MKFAKNEIRILKKYFYFKNLVRTLFVKINNKTVQQRVVNVIIKTKCCLKMYRPVIGIINHRGFAIMGIFFKVPNKDSSTVFFDLFVTPCIFFF